MSILLQLVIIIIKKLRLVVLDLNIITRVESWLIFFCSRGWRLLVCERLSEVTEAWDLGENNVLAKMIWAL